MNAEKDIIKKLVETDYWDERNAELGIRANFQCEYCNKDLLSSVENYKEWQVDHIVPQSAGGSDEMCNLALSCRTCNVNIKGTYNPQDDNPKAKNREALIETCREYISKKRVTLLKNVLEYRTIVFGEC